MVSLPALTMPNAPQSIEMVALQRALTDAIKPPETAAAAEPKRLRTWDLHESYHCSIVGTCLSPDELRQLLIKLGEPDTRKATDHTVHSRAVRIAARKDTAAKLLNKALDRKHDAAIRKTARITTVAELRAYWAETFETGDFVGAYWAVFSHPATDIDLMRDIFGTVLMLSHRLVSEGRQEISRIKALEGAILDRDEKLSRQEKRLCVAKEEQTDQVRQIEALRAALMREKISGRGMVEPEPARRQDTALETRLADEKAKADGLAEKLAEAREALRLAEEACRLSDARAVVLRRENDLVEAILAGDGAEAEISRSDAATGAVLYVGGRRRLYDKLRALAAERGVTLLLHDGGMEDNTTLLPTFVAQAEMVIFPVDHISHAAAGIVKRLCREGRKPYIPMRSAGLTSFVATISNPSGAIA